MEIYEEIKVDEEIEVDEVDEKIEEVFGRCG